MITRRGFAAVALSAAAAGWPLGGHAADDVLAQCADFIRETGNRLSSLNAAAGTPAEKQARLRAFIDEVVDVDTVARFSIGRFWRMATEAQQQEYLRLFHQMLFINVTSRMGDYNEGSARVTISRPTQSDGGIVVPTLVQRADAAPVHVVWLVSVDTGRPRIVDLLAEGMSLRLTLRSDYTTFLARNGNDIEALLKGLRQRAEQPQG